MADFDVSKDVLSLLKRIDANESTKQVNEVLECLKDLRKISMTVEILAKTKVGIHIGKLRKHSNGDVVSLANKCIADWKAVAANAGVKSKAAPSPKNEKSLKFGEKTLQVKQEMSSKQKDAPILSNSAEFLSPARQKVRNLLVNTFVKTIASYLSTEEGRKNLEESGMPIHEGVDAQINAGTCADELERELFEQLGGIDSYNPQPAYLDQAKKLVFNLPRNHALAVNIYYGFVPMDKVPKLSSDELKDESARREADKARTDGVNARMLDWNEKTRKERLSQLGLSSADSGLPCRKCKGKNTEYTQKQTRSADEPMTTFVFCHDCHARWKFC